jgi:hypothetical protein
MSFNENLFVIVFLEFCKLNLQLFDLLVHCFELSNDAFVYLVLSLLSIKQKLNFPLVLARFYIFGVLQNRFYIVFWCLIQGFIATLYSIFHFRSNFNYECRPSINTLLVSRLRGFQSIVHYLGFIFSCISFLCFSFVLLIKRIWFDTKIFLFPLNMILFYSTNILFNSNWLSFLQTSSEFCCYGFRF